MLSMQHIWTSGLSKNFRNRNGRNILIVILYLAAESVFFLRYGNTVSDASNLFINNNNIMHGANLESGQCEK